MSPAAAAQPRPQPPARETEHPSPRRPRLLLDAARHGLADYRAARDLPRLIGPHVPPTAILPRLSARESEMEALRLAGDPAWSCMRHVELLIALLAERAARP